MEDNKKLFGIININVLVLLCIVLLFSLITTTTRIIFNDYLYIYFIFILLSFIYAIALWILKKSDSTTRYIFTLAIILFIVLYMKMIYLGPHFN